jgi:hypothetical protein
VRAAHYIRDSHGHMRHMQDHAGRWDDHHDTYGHQVHLSHDLAMDIGWRVKDEIGSDAFNQMVAPALSAIGVQVISPMILAFCVVM